MTTKTQAKTSKNLVSAAMQVAHMYKTAVSYPIRIINNIINLAIQPIIRERESRLELEEKRKQIEKLPEWARKTYQRDWMFEGYETKDERISRIRSIAGRRGGKVTKSV